MSAPFRKSVTPILSEREETGSSILTEDFDRKMPVSCRSHGPAQILRSLNTTPEMKQ